MPVLDFQNAHLPTFHHPTVLARSTVDQGHVFPLLFDTGLRTTSCMFLKDQEEQYRQFTGAVKEKTKKTTLSLAPVGGAHAITIGDALALPAPAPAFARAVELDVILSNHATANSHHYLLKGQPRLIVWWSTAPGVVRTPVTLTNEELADIEDHFGHAPEVYAVPLSFVDPAGAAALPQSAQQVTLGVEVQMERGILAKVDLVGGGQVLHQVDACLDTGASYVVIRDRVAGLFGLPQQGDAHVTLPQLDFPRARPALSLRNVPTVVTRDLMADDVVIGSSLFDRFTQVVFDLGGQASTVRLLP